MKQKLTFRTFVGYGKMHGSRRVRRRGTFDDVRIVALICSARDNLNTIKGGLSSYRVLTSAHLAVLECRAKSRCRSQPARLLIVDLSSDLKKKVPS